MSTEDRIEKEVRKVAASYPDLVLRSITVSPPEGWEWRADKIAYIVTINADVPEEHQRVRHFADHYSRRVVSYAPLYMAGKPAHGVTPRDKHYWNTVYGNLPVLSGGYSLPDWEYEGDGVWEFYIRKEDLHKFE